MVKNKNLNIEALRGLLILMIIFYHYTFRFSELFNVETINFPIQNRLGIIGVGAFFIITGYFMIPKQNENFKMLVFFRKKLIRLYPAYFLCVTITYISIYLFGLSGRETSFIDYLLNVTLINGFIGTNYVDGAHWYLTYMIIFITLAGIYLKFFQKKDKNIYYFIVLLLIKDLIKAISHFYPSMTFVYALLGIDYLDFFIIGIGINFLLKKETAIKKWIRKDNFKELILIAIPFGNILIFRGITIFLTTILFTCLILKSIKSESKFIWKSKILLYIGEISFILYLIHQNIGYQLIIEFMELFNGYNLFIVFITFIIIFIISVIIYELYEKRIQKYIKKRLS